MNAVAAPPETYPLQGSPLREGSVLSGYVLDEHLASGGMGALWRASGPTGEQVAIKVVRDSIAADALYRDRFRREAEALAALSARWTPALVSVAPENERPHLVMEYLAGPTLKERVRSEGALATSDVYALAVGLAEGLAEVHALGMVHRDVKPSNIVMSDRGPVLIDFGIVLTDGSDTLTGTGLVMGSAGWTAPEVLYGERATAASDVFGWGANVLFGASGENPHGSGTMLAMAHDIQSGYISLTGLPETLAPIVEAATSLDPADRPTSRELVRMVRRAIRQERRRAQAQRLEESAAVLSLALASGLSVYAAAGL